MTSARFDLALIDDARAGQPAALERLLEVARPDLRRFAQKSCLVSDVDDAVQESLLVLSRYVSSLRHAQAWSRWMFRIVRRHCHRLARLALRQDLWGDERVELMLAKRSEHELRLDVAAALESLPAAQLEMIVLRDFEGLTIGEIARQLQATPAAVKGRLHRARELVREYLLAGEADPLS